jgi:hypothetical protein
VALSVCACGGNAKAPNGPASGSDTAAAPAGSAQAAAVGGAHTLVIANDTGIHHYSSEGTKLKTLTSTPGRWPRVLGGGEVLFLDPEDRDSRALRAVDTSGKVRVVARLPRGYSTKDCAFLEAAHDTSQRVAPQSDSDFVVDRDANTVCLSLLDRNENMADLSVTVGVDLATGKVDKWLTMDSNKDCNIAKRPATGIGLQKGGKNFACSGTAASRPRPPASTAAHPFSFDAKRQAIVGGGSAVAFGTTEDNGFTVAGSSPSGRWVLLSGCTEGADYFHSQVLMFDRTGGGVYSVTKGPWPRALDAKQIAAIGACETKTLSVVGETPIWWVGHKDHLVVGNTVVLPGVKAWNFEGHAAP